MNKIIKMYLFAVVLISLVGIIIGTSVAEIKPTEVTEDNEFEDNVFPNSCINMDSWASQDAWGYYNNNLQWLRKGKNWDI